MQKSFSTFFPPQTAPSPPRAFRTTTTAVILNKRGASIKRYSLFQRAYLVEKNFYNIYCTRVSTTLTLLKQWIRRGTVFEIYLFLKIESNSSWDIYIVSLERQSSTISLVIFQRKRDTFKRIQKHSLRGQKGFEEIGRWKNPENLSWKASLSRFTESPIVFVRDCATLETHRHSRAFRTPTERPWTLLSRIESWRRRLAVRPNANYLRLGSATCRGRSRHVENLGDRYAALGGGGEIIGQ